MTRNINTCSDKDHIYESNYIYSSILSTTFHFVYIKIADYICDLFIPLIIFHRKQ